MIKKSEVQALPMTYQLTESGLEQIEEAMETMQRDETPGTSPKG